MDMSVCWIAGSNRGRSLDGCSVGRDWPRFTIVQAGVM